jgi:hypothetical protein
MYTSTQRGTSGISSGSIDALRVQLMKMNAQQLQAFAQANQDDAIKLSLAAEADKYKKQHGQEAMALMSGQQQKPPIAQQILQSIGQPPQQQQPQGPQQGQGPMPPQGQGGPMPPQGMPPQGMPPQMAQGQMPPQGMADGGYVLPEDQGIATLPVGNMDFAEGGIVGYADRGLVKAGFMMPPEIPDGAIVMGNMYKDPDTGEMKYIPGSEPERSEYAGMTLSDLGGEIKSGLGKLLLNPKEQRRAEIRKQNIQAEERIGPVMKGYKPRRSDEQQFQSDVAQRNNLPDPTATAVTTSGAGAAPPVPPAALDKRGLPSRPKLAEPTMPQQGGISALATKPEDLQRIYGNMVPPAADPFEGRIRNIGEMEQANAAAALAQRRQDIADLGPAYTEREAKLKDRQGRIEKEEGKLPYMAMLEAGLAMMSGTSPHAFVNIGAGGATGVKSYKQGIDKISEAKDKLDDAFGRIEEARRSEKVLNTRELRELENNVRKTVSQTERDVLAGAQQAYGLSQQQAGKMFEAYVGNKRAEFEQGAATDRTLIQERGANARTQAQLSAPPAEARMAMMLGTGKTDAERLESGLRKVQDLQSDKTGATYAKLYADHVTESKKQMTEPMTPTEFAASMRGILTAMSPKVTTMPGANAPVYDRPK